MKGCRFGYFLPLFVAAHRAFWAAATRALPSGLIVRFFTAFFAAFVVANTVSDFLGRPRRLTVAAGPASRFLACWRRDNSASMLERMAETSIALDCRASPVGRIPRNATPVAGGESADWESDDCLQIAVPTLHGRGGRDERKICWPERLHLDGIALKLDGRSLGFRLGDLRDIRNGKLFQHGSLRRVDLVAV